jgi:hypothetical protein
MDRPQIIVFTNVLPDQAFMTPDRWEIWEMKDKALEKLGLPALCAIKAIGF